MELHYTITIREGHNYFRHFAPGLRTTSSAQFFRNPDVRTQSEFLDQQRDLGVGELLLVDVLRGVVQGLSNEEIAGALGIEKSTVRSHVSTILNKLELDNRTQAALYAIERGLGRSGEEF